MSDSVAIRTVEAGRGLSWLSEGFELFKKAPGVWIGSTLLLLVVGWALSHLPLGSLILDLGFTVVLGGLMLGCKAQAEGAPLKLEHLVAAFNPPHLVPLLILSLLALLGTALIGLIAGALSLGALGAGAFSGDFTEVRITLGLVFAVLLAFALLLPLMMATWFAPPLIVLGGLQPVAALKASFDACLRNIVPFLVYGLLGLLIAIAAAIPFGLGLLVAIPVFIASVYTGYRDIFQPTSA